MKKVELKIPSETYIREKILQSLQESEKSKFAILNLLPFTLFEADQNGTILDLKSSDDLYFIRSGDIIWHYFCDFNRVEWQKWYERITESHHSSRTIKLHGSELSQSIIYNCTIVKLKSKVVGSLIGLDQSENLAESKVKFGLSGANASYIKSVTNNISDTIRTPLNHIMLCAETLVSEFSESGSHKSEALVESILNKIELIDNSLKALDCLSELDEMNLNQFTLKININELEEFIEELNQKGGIKINYNVDKNLKNVQMLGTQRFFYQAIECILINAKQHAKQKVTVKMVYTTEEQESLGIEISDDGDGLEAAKMYKICDLGWRGDITLTRSKKGMGMGLSYVQKYFEKVKGMYCIDSAKGKGTLVSVRIPCEKIYD